MICVTGINESIFAPCQEMDVVATRGLLEIEVGISIKSMPVS